MTHGNTQHVLSETEAAARMGIKRRSLEQRRRLGHSCPPFIKTGNRIAYPRLEFEAWIAGKMQRG